MHLLLFSLFHSTLRNFIYLSVTFVSLCAPFLKIMFILTFCVLLHFIHFYIFTINHLNPFPTLTLCPYLTIYLLLHFISVYVLSISPFSVLSFPFLLNSMYFYILFTPTFNPLLHFIYPFKLSTPTFLHLISFSNVPQLIHFIYSYVSTFYLLLLHFIYSYYISSTLTFVYILSTPTTFYLFFLHFIYSYYILSTLTFSPFYLLLRSPTYILSTFTFPKFLHFIYSYISQNSQPLLLHFIYSSVLYILSTLLTLYLPFIYLHFI